VHEDTVLRLTRLRGAAVGADESVRAVVEADWVPLPALVNGITENVYVTYGRSPVIVADSVETLNTVTVLLGTTRRASVVR